MQHDPQRDREWLHATEGSDPFVASNLGLLFLVRISECRSQSVLGDW